MDKAREAVYQILRKCFDQGAYANIALQALSRNDYSRTDRAFATEMVYGTVSWRRTLDYVLGGFASIPIRKMSPQVHTLLMMGAYQILYMDRVPDSAACNTSVDLAKVHCKKSSGFVNGVLRSLVRGKEDIRWPDQNEDPITSLGVRYSYPDWMVATWCTQFGRETAEALMAAGNTHPPLTIRVNRMKNNREALLSVLEEEFITASPGEVCEDAIVLHSPEQFNKLNSFLEGRFSVQDESAMLVAQILDPQPGEMVLDMCCAPGGKTTHIAERMQNQGHVLGWDLHANKLPLVMESANRLDISIIEVAEQDAEIHKPEMVGRCDRVLVDVPCSGTGIIRRKPDIKWHRSPSDIGALVEIQKKILYNASSYIKDDGILVYSTCSMEKEENEGVCDWFLQKMQVSQTGSAFVLEETKKLYPTNPETDGFFIARFRKQAK